MGEDFLGGLREWSLMGEWSLLFEVKREFFQPIDLGFCQFIV